MKVEFAGGSYETFSKDLNAQECVNFFVHLDQEGGSSQLSLRATPGLKEWLDTGHNAEVRGMHKFGAYLYAVVGNRVYQASSTATSTLCTGTLVSGKNAVGTVDLVNPLVGSDSESSLSPPASSLERN